MQAISKAELSLSAPERTVERPVRSASAALTVSDHKALESHKASDGVGTEGKGAKVRATLRARLGEDIYTSWFNALEFDEFDGTTVKVSVPVKFLRKWIQSHYLDELLTCCKSEFKTAERVEVAVRQPGVSPSRAPVQQAEPVKTSREATAIEPRALGSFEPVRMQVVRPVAGRTSIDGFEGSPLDPHHTFDNFVVGASNRMAHAGAIQVAETVLTDSPAFNPLYLYSSVGLGKTHLLQAIAWEVKRRAQNAQVLYLTAERFRYQFVEALRNQDPLSFKDKFRSINMLLIDDLEFMQGEKTEQEFDHIINALLDGGRQVVVASARHPAQIERLNERMRSRLQRGLVAEIGGFDYELRQRVLEQRLAEKRATDPAFELSREVIEILASRLTESGRELEGAVNRLYLTWQHMRAPITLDIAETVVRDLFQGVEPRRIKIEDILRIISRHFGVSKGDLLSQRRHRSVVWPRQIGMYLAKQLTHRSLPEIGRRFGNRDHTTVLHAIRKIEGVITNDTGLRDEIDELKKLLSH
ncbi:chromosomal replication initiator protein DnaA [Hyphomicrobium sp. LHD-15]|uniref:chromosomal replication initiator protein DnaA n=1 Tax=Hyphomicrobium sp. LHD-15 TaxID=3072142 RepID=UPI00280EDDFE|nr:chromosomal replication initiator protein DnaA [Hyphomicrobium sp. LHD-15]MDQ8699984.1 chromosomal replication initiator protein DnaA [Hyphomicrobium sp. LHD-15]